MHKSCKLARKLSSQRHKVKNLDASKDQMPLSVTKKNQKGTKNKNIDIQD